MGAKRHEFLTGDDVLRSRSLEPARKNTVVRAMFGPQPMQRIRYMENSEGDVGTDPGPIDSLPRPCIAGIIRNSGDEFNHRTP